MGLGSIFLTPALVLLWIGASIFIPKFRWHFLTIELWSYGYLLYLASLLPDNLPLRLQAMENDNDKPPPYLSPERPSRFQGLTGWVPCGVTCPPVFKCSHLPCVFVFYRFILEFNGVVLLVVGVDVSFI